MNIKHKILTAYGGAICAGIYLPLFLLHYLNLNFYSTIPLTLLVIVISMFIINNTVDELELNETVNGDIVNKSEDHSSHVTEMLSTVKESSEIQLQSIERVSTLCDELKVISRSFSRFLISIYIP